jgi:NAD(P)-dependent dehydrogenase (short-subunit alcohol dehydrogenase family)
MIDLSGKVAVVSGAASGLGEASAKMLAAGGAAVVIADINEGDAERVASEISADGQTAVAHRVDISVDEEVDGLFEMVARQFGRLDILDNNAGLTSKTQVEADLDLVSLDTAIWDRSFAVNARGTMLMSRRAIPLMLDSGGGSIINITSQAALWGDVRSTAYGAAKASLIALTRYIATQHLHDGIRCNAIAPGMVLTPATLAATLADDSGRGPLLQAMNRHHNRPGDPKDIAGVVLFLASDLSAFMTGQILSVDGGLSMHTPVLPERLEMARVLRSTQR